MKKILLLCLSFAISCNAYSIIVYGHRGARGLAPENTIPGIQEALKHKVDVIDVDVVMTKDLELVTYHDLTLNPDTTKNNNGTWVTSESLAVKNLTLNQLKTFDVGEIRPNSDYAKIFYKQIPAISTKIPTLKEVISFIKANSKSRPTKLQIEIKTDPTHPEYSVKPQTIVYALNRIINEENIANITKVQAYDWSCLLLIHKLNPKVATGYITDKNHELVLKSSDINKANLWTGGYLLKDYNNSIPFMIASLGGTWWDAEDIELNENLIQEAHKYGLKVAAWSWPENSSHTDININLSRNLISMHIDGIITDRPDIIKSLLILQPQSTTASL